MEACLPPILHQMRYVFVLKVADIPFLTMIKSRFFLSKPRTKNDFVQVNLIFFYSRWEIPLDAVYLDGQKLADSTIPGQGINSPSLSALIDTVGLPAEFINTSSTANMSH
jgi:hypothetical protein